MNPTIATVAAFGGSLALMGGYAVRVALALRAERKRAATPAGPEEPKNGGMCTRELKPMGRVRAL